MFDRFVNTRCVGLKEFGKRNIGNSSALPGRCQLEMAARKVLQTLQENIRGGEIMIGPP